MDDGSFDKKDVNLDEASLETPDMEESLETPEVGTTIEAEDTGSTEVAADTNVGDLPVEDIDPAVDTPAEEPVVKSNPFLDDAPKAEEPAAEEPAVETPAVEESAADAEPVETPVETPVENVDEPAAETVSEPEEPAETEPVAEEPVAEATPEAASEATPEVATEAVEATAPAVAAAVATDVSPAPAEPAKEKKKGGNKALVIILVIVLLAAAGLCGWYFFSNMGSSNTNNEANKPTEEKEEVSYEIKGNGLNDFDLSFLKLENEGSNKVYSPLSIKIALSMLSEGADGDTKDQIDKIIGSYEAKKYINSENLSLANGLFVKDSYKADIKDSFVKTLNDKYNADVVYDSFGDATNFNNWISSKTLKQIDSVFSDDEISQFNYILANALAIDMKWDNKLQCTWGSNDCLIYNVSFAHEKYNDEVAIVEGDKFDKISFDKQKDMPASKIGASINNYDVVKKVGEDKIKSTVKAEYEKWLKTAEGEPYYDDSGKALSVDEYIEKVYLAELKANYGKVETSSNYSILNDDDVKVFAKDLKEYGGTTLQYVAIMPKETELKDYIKDITAEKLNEKISNLKELKKENFKDGVITKIKGYIPFFKYNDKLKLIDDLKSIGVKDVFDGKKADLSKLTSDKGAHIADMRHVATIELSNDGIKAAAVTAGGGLGDGGYPFEYKWDVEVEEIDMTFDKPFMYLIRDKKTGEVWFTGAVYKVGNN